MRRLLISFLFASVCWAQFPTDSRGIIQTGLPAAQDNLLGPLIPSGNSPWVYSDLAESGVAVNMAPLALAQAPALGTALAGTVSYTGGGADFNITTTADQTAAIAASPPNLGGGKWIVVAWNSVDGAGTGRMLCPISSVTSTTIACGEYIQEPSASGVTAYLLPAPITISGDPVDFQDWTTEGPQHVWNYYDVAIALYRLYYRTGNTQYQTWARQYADITWQWTLDHGYRSVSPRASTLLSQFFRALDGHPERFPYLYDWINFQMPRWTPTGCPFCDIREVGYETWGVALGAKTDPDATRHGAYCSWLTTYLPQWSTAAQVDGSFGERVFPNGIYVDAPKAYTLPIVYQSSPWRHTIAAKGLEASYEVMDSADPTYGCNQPTIAAATLTTITNFITWQRNYGRDSVGRGTAYEVNSMSQDQNSNYFTGAPTPGTIAVNVGSPTLTGTGTAFITDGYNTGHFIGIINPVNLAPNLSSVYSISSCSSDTVCTLSVNFGFFGETLNVSGASYNTAPGNTPGGCNSSATYCFDGDDRNLTRVECGAIGWLYAQTHTSTYLAWADECVSASLGGPTTGLSSSNIVDLYNFYTPCSGPACDGYVADSVQSAATCGTTPCIYFGSVYANLGKNFGETWGAPGIDNELAWRNWFNTVASTVVSSKAAMSGKALLP